MNASMVDLLDFLDEVVGLDGDPRTAEVKITLPTAPAGGWCGVEIGGRPAVGLSALALVGAVTVAGHAADPPGLASLILVGPDGTHADAGQHRLGSRVEYLWGEIAAALLFPSTEEIRASDELRAGGAAALGLAAKARRGAAPTKSDGAPTPSAVTKGVAAPPHAG